jgi:histone acetyltransferase
MAVFQGFLLYTDDGRSDFGRLCDLTSYYTNVPLFHTGNSLTMKRLYPSSADIPSLTQSQLALKIARHSPCSACDSCTGLRPPADVEVVLDDAIASSSLGDLEQYGSDDDNAITDYLELCTCGHGVQEHVSEIGTEEFNRRAKVAVRLDEILHVSLNI